MSAEECTAMSMGIRCQLRAGHNSPHRNETEGCIATWEPRYVADLRRELEDALEWRRLLADVLDDIGPGLTSDTIQDANDALDAFEERQAAASTEEERHGG